MKDSDLASLILDRLQEDGVAIKSSTESAIRYMIGDRVVGYRAKLVHSIESLDTEFKKN